MLATLEGLSFAQLLGLSSAYIFGRGVLLYGAFALLKRVLGSRRTVSHEVYEPGQFRSELSANIKVNLVDSFVLAAVVALHWVRNHELTPLTFLSGFVFSYLFFETWFYWVHRGLHTRKFRFIHRQHHLSRATGPLSALSLSVPEKCLNVTGMYVIPCLMTWVLPLSFEGIATYHLTNFVVNVLGHSNLEVLPRGHEKTWMGKVFATSTYHSIHHLKGTAHFGLFTSFWDKVIGTYDSNYPEAYRRSVGE
jgi:sterol desaturase/sphingolipid hydroxylase (fatty acid hydroxylase superfamily)